MPNQRKPRRWLSRYRHRFKFYAVAHNVLLGGLLINVLLLMKMYLDLNSSRPAEQIK